MRVKENTPMDFDTWFKISERLEEALKNIMSNVEAEGLDHWASYVEAKKLLEELN